MDTVVVIMSHGNEDGIAGTDNKYLTKEKLRQILKDAAHAQGVTRQFTLALVQACR